MKQRYIVLYLALISLTLSATTKLEQCMAEPNTVVFPMKAIPILTTQIQDGKVILPHEQIKVFIALMAKQQHDSDDSDDE